MEGLEQEQACTQVLATLGQISYVGSFTHLPWLGAGTVSVALKRYGHLTPFLPCFLFLIFIFFRFFFYFFLASSLAFLLPPLSYTHIHSSHTAPTNTPSPSTTTTNQQPTTTST